MDSKIIGLVFGLVLLLGVLAFYSLPEYEDHYFISPIEGMPGYYFHRVVWGVAANHEMVVVSKDSSKIDRGGRERNFVCEITNTTPIYYISMGDTLEIFSIAGGIVNGMDSSSINVIVKHVSNPAFMKLGEKEGVTQF